MQTTITIPNAVYEATEQLAQQLDLSQCDFYAIALKAYVTSHKPEDLTDALSSLRERIVGHG